MSALNMLGQNDFYTNLYFAIKNCIKKTEQSLLTLSRFLALPQCFHVAHIDGGKYRLRPSCAVMVL